MDSNHTIIKSLNATIIISTQSGDVQIDGASTKSDLTIVYFQIPTTLLESGSFKANFQGPVYGSFLNAPECTGEFKF